MFGMGGYNLIIDEACGIIDCCMALNKSINMPSQRNILMQDEAEARSEFNEELPSHPSFPFPILVPPRDK